MGISRMRRKMGIHMRLLMLGMVIVFAVGMLVYFVPSGGMLPPTAGQAPAASEVVAQVGDQKITRRELELAARQQMGGSVPLAEVEFVRYYTLQGVIDRARMLQLAKQLQIRVSDTEVKRQVDKTMQTLRQQTRGQGLTRLMLQVMQQQGEPVDSVNEAQFRDWLAEQLTPTLIINKLQAVVASSTKTTEQDVWDAYTTLHLKGILISTDGRTGKRTDQDAFGLAKQIRQKISQASELDQLARQHSDAPSFQNGGDLGILKAPEIEQAYGPEVARAALALSPGRVSDPVKTPRGYYLLAALSRQVKLPADYDKKKDTYLKQVTEDRQQKALMNIHQQAVEQFKVKLLDDELRGLEAMYSGKPDSEKAAKYFEKALADPNLSGDGRAGLAFTLGGIYAARASTASDPETKRKNWQLALAQYQIAKDNYSKPVWEAYLAIADVYAKQGNTKQALATLNRAKEYNSDQPDLRAKLVTAYRDLGQAALAQAEQEWVDNYNKQQAKERAQQKALEIRPQPAGKPAAAK